MFESLLNKNFEKYSNRLNRRLIIITIDLTSPLLHTSHVTRHTSKALFRVFDSFIWYYTLCQSSRYDII